MRKVFAPMFLIVLLCFVASAARSQGSPSDSAILSEADARHTAQEWAALVSQGNVTELESLLSDKYVHIHSTALVESKAQFLDALKNGTRKYDPINLEDLAVRVFGSCAVVTGKFHLKALARGKVIEGDRRFGLVVVKTQNGQQVVSYQATPIPPQQ